MNTRFMKVNLSMFDEASIDSPGDSSTQTSNGIENAPKLSSGYASQVEAPDSKVVYGLQDSVIPPNAQGEVAGTEKPDRQAEYQRYKNEYKDLYGKDVEGIVKDRFKKYDGLEQRIGEVNPLLELLYEQHGVNDIESLRAILQESNIENMAYKEGYTVEQAKEIYELKQNNKMLSQEVETFGEVARQSAEQIEVDSKVQDWMTQADAVKKDYASFDLGTQSNNPQFMKLLHAGIDVKTAYEVSNINEVKSDVAKRMEQNTIQDIRAKGQRPKENGLNATPGIVVKSSANGLTKEDRQEIARRVARGEEIKF